MNSLRPLVCFSISTLGFQGSLSRALGLTKSKSEREREKQSPTSSSESSSVVSRISPPLLYYRNSRNSGEESPIYAQPFAHAQNLYQRRSEDYDTYVCSSIRSIGEYDVTKSATNIMKPDQRDNISAKSEKFKMISHLKGGSLHRNRKQHRRVRSIGDIDIIHVEAV